MGQDVKNLYEKLVSYAGSDYYGFHMPGHKRNKAAVRVGLPYEIDITEIEGFDDLHHAKGILRQAQERAAKIFHAEETYFLINGSTAGILSAILGCTQRGDRILVARNCHKSVYHAVYLNELEPIYIYPSFYEEEELNGPVRVEDVRHLLEGEKDLPKERRIRAVVITSPTYDGVVSDVERLARLAHSYGIPLIVDEAHGAHFGFHPYFPENSNRKGADVVIHSIHKTLPALTQTALIHINGRFADRERIKKYLQIVQTSSPSYVLMAGIDACVDVLSGKRKDILFENYVILLDKTRDRLKKMRHLRLIETDFFDCSKIVISVKGTKYSGRELYGRLLEEFHLQMEMAAGSYVLAMTSVGDTQEGFERLVQALQQIDREIDLKDENHTFDRMSVKNNDEYAHDETQLFTGKQEFRLPVLEYVCSGAEAERIERKDAERVNVMPWDDCAGFVSMEYAYLYPPGIPLIVPGERISEEAISLIREYGKMGFKIEGVKNDGFIKVIRNC